jgi:hypothetical protein
MAKDEYPENSKGFVSLEEYLASEPGPVNDLLFFVSPVKDEPDKIKLTLVGDHGCHCSTAIVVEKTVVAGVQPHGHKTCCGKKQAVVGVFFKKNASISLVDLFDQLQKNASGIRLPRQPQRRYTGRRIPIFFPIGGPGEYGAGVPSGGGEQAPTVSENLQNCLDQATYDFALATAQCPPYPPEAYALCFNTAQTNFSLAVIACGQAATEQAQQIANDASNNEDDPDEDEPGEDMTS